MTDTLEQKPRSVNLPFSNREEVYVSGYGRSTFIAYIVQGEERRYVFESPSPEAPVDRIIIGSNPFSDKKTGRVSFEKIRVVSIQNLFYLTVHILVMGLLVAWLLSHSGI